MREEGNARGAVLARRSYLEPLDLRFRARPRLVDEQAVRGEDPRQVRRDRLMAREVVGRVEEDEVVCVALHRDRSGDVRAEDGRVEPQLVEVRVDRAAR